MTTLNETSTTLEPRLATDQVNAAILGSWPDERLASRALVTRPEVQQVNGLSMAEHRERVLSQLHVLVDEGAIQRAFPAHLGGGDNPGGNIAAFEELVIADPSLQIKSGVQWGLFGAAILQLGTQPHHDKWLPDVMSLKLPGAFAMTETGHGSDVASIGTTATYDPESGEWEINTPFRGAWKDYLGNAALHGRAAVVFAQLITRGENHGVHAFFVPIRTADGELLPGVRSEDDGLKGGLNGIDNGRLRFDHVRVPRTNLLNRYGDVAADGRYSSPIESKGRRFFTMLGTLVQGRVSLDGAATTASALGLDIAIRYGTQRRQFNASSTTHEEVLLDYQRHQRRLLPRLATTYAQFFAHDRLLTKFHDVFAGVNDSDENRQDLETLAAALKPLSTWHALYTLQECREACGGQGFLAENRFVGLRHDLDVYVTFEGDNNVLLQLVGKRLLKDFAREAAGNPAGFVAGQVGDTLLNRSGLRRVTQNLADFGSMARSVDQLQDSDEQHALLADRVHTMIGDIAGRLRPVAKLSQARQAAVFNENQNELIEAARAHGELLQWEAFTAAVETFDDSGTRLVMTWLRDLFAFSLIEKHAAWYLENGRLSGQRTKAVTAYINRLVSRLRPHALDLVGAFGYTDDHRRAPIATDAEQTRQDEAAAYYAALRE